LVSGQFGDSVNGQQRPLPGTPSCLNMAAKAAHPAVLRLLTATDTLSAATTGRVHYAGDSIGNTVPAASWEEW
jgi:hypothetical protein